jgi:hypothetical protein
MDQKTAATRIASEEIPVCEPYSHGSTTLAVINSRTMNRPKIKRTWVQPGKTASAMAIGNAAAIRVPT